MASCKWKAINVPSMSYSKKTVGDKKFRKEDFQVNYGFINNFMPISWGPG